MRRPDPRPARASGRRCESTPLVCRSRCKSLNVSDRPAIVVATQPLPAQRSSRRLADPRPTSRARVCEPHSRTRPPGCRRDRWCRLPRGAQTQIANERSSISARRDFGGEPNPLAVNARATRSAASANCQGRSGTLSAVHFRVAPRGTRRRHRVRSAGGSARRGTNATRRVWVFKATRLTGSSVGWTGRATTSTPRGDLISATDEVAIHTGSRRHAKRVACGKTDSHQTAPPADASCRGTVCVLGFYCSQEDSNFVVPNNPNTWKLREVAWRLRLEWGREDSNLRRLSRRVYSPFPLATRAHPRERGL